MIMIRDRGPEKAVSVLGPVLGEELDCQKARRGRCLGFFNDDFAVLPDVNRRTCMRAVLRASLAARRKARPTAAKNSFVCFFTGVRFMVLVPTCVLFYRRYQSLQHEGSTAMSSSDETARIRLFIGVIFYRFSMSHFMPKSL